jgi:hypothetical protein
MDSSDAKKRKICELLKLAVRTIIEHRSLSTEYLLLHRVFTTGGIVIDLNGSSGIKVIGSGRQRSAAQPRRLQEAKSFRSQTRNDSQATTSSPGSCISLYPCTCLLSPSGLLTAITINHRTQNHPSSANRTIAHPQHSEHGSKPIVFHHRKPPQSLIFTNPSAT